MKFQKENPKVIIGALIAVGILLFLGGYFLFIRSAEETLLWETTSQMSEGFIASDIESTEKNSPIEMMVDIKGAVQNPGVYTLSTEARLNELILMAGGFTEEAEIRQLNLAEKLTDQQMIYVPNKEEVDFKVENIQKNETVEKKSETTLINLNTADSIELQQLPGVGPAKAQAILTYREENGTFNQVDDLLQISGFGEKTVEKLRELVTI